MNSGGSPPDAEVLHRQGIIAYQGGRYDTAVEMIGRSIAVRATAGAHVNLGAALMALGRHREALDSYDAAIALDPGCVEAHAYRGTALLQSQRTAEALASLERALSLQPRSPELHNNRGNVLRRLHRLAEALASYDRAIALQPGFAAAHHNRGLALQALGRFPEAAACYRRALELQPDLAATHNNLGTVLCELGQPAAAIECCRRALELQPDMRGVHGNLGNALRDLQRPDEALAEYELALVEDPRDADNHCHRGNALADLKLLPQALASYERALALDPRHAQAHFNKGVILLLMGEYPTGLRCYEWRPRTGAEAPAVAAPEWHGAEPIAGKTLLLHADQALGDTIQFCRYAQLAAERGARVILAVQPQLRELLGGLGPAIRVVALGEAHVACDYHCRLGSLPLAFGTTLAGIPAAVPYLHADPQRVAAWRQRLGSSGFRVAIAWQGSRNRIDVGRSVPLELFLRLASVPGVRLISLQKGAGVEQLSKASPGGIVEVLGEEFDAGSQAFLDSAAVMAQVDLIITCDTALAHLAGALGRPAWIALKHVPDWRWLLDRDDSPWYPSVRLFRQPRRGDWDSVFAAMRRELTRLAAAPAAAPPRDA